MNDDGQFDPAMVQVEKELTQQLPALVAQIKSVASKKQGATVAEDHIQRILGRFDEDKVSRAFFMLDAMLWEELDGWFDESVRNFGLFQHIMSLVVANPAVRRRASVKERLDTICDKYEKIKGKESKATPSPRSSA